MANESVYLNGKLLPAEQAHISIGDVGFLHGGSVFTTLAAFAGTPLRLEAHLARLLNSAQTLGLRVGPEATAPALTQAVRDLLAANALTSADSRARIRITLTPGDIQSDTPTTLVTANPLPQYPPEMYQKGITVVVTSLKQSAGDPTYGYKTGCYFPRIMARQEAHAKGAQEALWFTPDNRLAEGCFTNVFLVKQGKVLTPPRDTPVLPGITRQTVLEICQTEGIPFQDEQSLFIQDVLEAEESFLTASTMGIVPVTLVERHVVGGEKLGPVTERIMNAYNQLVDRETGRE